MNDSCNEEYSDYTVRIRFCIPENKSLNIDETEIFLGRYLEYGEFYLKSADKRSSIKEADWLVAIVSEFPSEEVANSAAIDIEDVLIRSMASINFGADFGRRGSGGGFFNNYLDMMSEQTGRVVLNDYVGAMVYATELDPVVARVGDTSVAISVQSDRLIESFQSSLNFSQRLSERERMSFDLFTMAHKVKESADARFVLLFAAIETLLEPTSRPQASVEHVENLITLTNEADLPTNEKQSLVGTLCWLKSHSIRSSGKIFIASNLRNKKYGGVVAERFFIECYNLRNRLMHGQQPHVDWREVCNRAAPLEVMVSDLLSRRTEHNED